MPSGKRARQQRQAAAAAVRTPPPVRSKGGGGARARQASPRALAIAGGVVVLAAIAIVLGVVLGGGGGGGGIVSASDIQGLPRVGSQTWPGALTGAGEANDLFKGIPQRGLTLGNPKAKVEMEMFIDVQCPFCQDYETNTLPTVVRRYIGTGKVQLHLQPWAFLGSQSFTGRDALIAASFQNKGFEYAKVLYDNQVQENTGWLNGKEMAAIAASVTGLNLAQWQADTDSAAPKAITNQVDSLAQQLQSKGILTGTPTILVGRFGGNLSLVGTPGHEATLQQTTQALDAALANS